MKHFSRATSRATSSAAAAPRSALPARRGQSEPRSRRAPLIELVPAAAAFAAGMGDAAECSSPPHFGGSSSRRQRGASVRPARAVVEAPNTPAHRSPVAADLPPRHARPQLGPSSHSIPVTSDDLSGGSDAEGAAASTTAPTPRASQVRRRASAARRGGSSGAAPQQAGSSRQQQRKAPPPPPPPSPPAGARIRLARLASAGVLCAAFVLLAAAAAISSSSTSRALGAVARSSSSSSGAQPAAAAAGGGGGGWWTPAAPGSTSSTPGSPHGYPALSLQAAAAWVHAAAGWQRRAGAASAAAERSASGSWVRSMHGGGSQQQGLKGAATPLAAASSQGASTAAAAGDDGGTPPSGDSSGGGGGSRAAPGSSIPMFVVVDAAAPSPFKAHSPQAADGAAGPDWSSSWGDVVAHMARRLAWTDERFDLQVITQQQLRESQAARDSLRAALSSSSSSSSPPPLLFGIGVTDPGVAAFLAEATAQLPTALFWDSAPQLGSASRVDGFAPATAGPFAQLLAKHVGFSREAKAAQVLKTLDILWARQTSDDLLYTWLVLLNQYVTPVPLVANTTKGTDAASLLCMIRHCGRQIMDCVGDKTCKAGLDCLEGCEFNDQVCQYRCIVSHETPKFANFALCILQLHNCRGLDAQIPMQPDPAPMATWRGSPLSHEAAENLFIGWMAAGPQLPSPDAPLQPFSWLVAAGKNPAYDAFGCQHQLYSRGKGRGQLWYEPVFKVTTLDGQDVWRRRRYRVRRGERPGTFYYSVLDNGVTSNEFWRIIDCAEDLSYCLFYYSGAAATAGMSYSGAVLGTRDGQWPTAHTQRVHAALRDSGIEPWELTLVDNSQCAGAPLAA